MLDKPPLQSRSRDTLERIVDAAVSLLQDRPFEAVTVRDIARRARCPTGSFYARFKAKDDLLPYLYERYDATLDEGVGQRLASVAWETLDLRGVCAHGVDLMVAMYVERRWLLREMALYARRNPKSLPAALVARRSDLHGRPVEYFNRHRNVIAHPSPERAIEVGLYTAAAAARDAILFAEAPHAAVTRLSTGALKATLSHSLYHFLSQPCLPPHDCCSPPAAPSSSSRPASKSTRRRHR